MTEIDHLDLIGTPEYRPERGRQAGEARPKSPAILALTAQIADQDASNLVRVLAGQGSVNLRVVFPRIANEDEPTMGEQCQDRFDGLTLGLLGRGEQVEEARVGPAKALEMH